MKIEGFLYTAVERTDFCYHKLEMFLYVRTDLKTESAVRNLLMWFQMSPLLLMS